MKAMIGIVFLILGCFFTLNPVFAEDADTCSYDKESMLELEQRDFDQNFNSGWRAVNKKGACNLTAADLIRAYIEKNGEDGLIMTWHEGQLRAMAGQTERAIELFEDAREPEDQDDWFGWNIYVDATIAFLKKDHDALIRAKGSLLNLPRPDRDNPVDSFGNPVSIRWPPNLNVVEGLLECFSDSYDYAYNNCVTALAIDTDE